MVAVLEERGLVDRLPHAHDRRRRVLRLTDRGHELLDRFRDEVRQVEARMVSPLTPAEAEDLRRYVVLCRAALETRPPG